MLVCVPMYSSVWPHYLIRDIDQEMVQRRFTKRLCSMWHLLYAERLYVSLNLTAVCPAAVGKGTISVAFVRPSVAYIANNSRTQRPSVPKLEGRFPTLNALMLTHIVHRVFKRQGLYKLQTWYTDGGRRPVSAQAPWPLRSKVKLVLPSFNTVIHNSSVILSLSRHRSYIISLSVT